MAYEVEVVYEKRFLQIYKISKKYRVKVMYTKFVLIGLWGSFPQTSIIYLLKLQSFQAVKTVV